MRIFFFLAFVIVTTNQAYSQDASKGGELYKTCVQCHGADGLGVEKMEGPKIAGQYDWYIVTQLQNFRSKTRVNPTMYPFIKNLSDKDFADLAAYVSGL